MMISVPSKKGFSNLLSYDDQTFKFGISLSDKIFHGNKWKMISSVSVNQLYVGEGISTPNIGANQIDIQSVLNIIIDLIYVNICHNCMIISCEYFMFYIL